MSSPNVTARLSAACYVLTTVLGASAFVLNGRVSDILNLIAALFYLAVTVLFFKLFQPVSVAGSLLAMLFSFAGCGLQILDSLNVNPFHVNNIIFFGFYCLIIGYLERIRYCCRVCLEV